MGEPNFGGLTDTCVTLKGGVVFPHEQNNTCGVLAADGSFCEMSRGVMGPRRAASPPVMPDAAEIGDLEGRYIYGGWLRAHFGHFLLESTARLWAAGTMDRPIDGVIFTPFRSGGVVQARKRYAPFLKILTGGVPLKILRNPTRVAELIVPDPGFGHHNRVLGSPQYRAQTRAQVARAIPAEGPEKLYVSRSDLIDKRGGIFGETHIEALMEANGYTIFHPQKHSIPAQLAHYRAAREVVALDGSALHLAAYALQPGARVGMILRRHAGLLDGLAEQLRLFAEVDVQMIDALVASWVDEDAKRVDFRSVGELDFPLLQQKLIDAGFTHPGPLLQPCDVPALVAAMDRGPLRRVPVTH